ncbi:ABC transporter permease [Streptomyces triticirhizae]|uniref:ABC transporter permease n=1 Tax=Streptomyces triticirhizae TaxID=2483353 RepID=A0A3M2LIG0_9ACTN|nr:ABC transporter permease [Streptomyces triticirhizae]RMI36906.1 ABC transporter permease [Streptomyces triticirhizae]
MTQSTAPPLVAPGDPPPTDADASPPAPASTERSPGRSTARSARRSLAGAALAAALRLRRVSGLIAVLLLWWLGSGQGWLGSTTPSPGSVWSAAVELVRSGEYTHHLGVSLERVGKGLAIGIPLGIALGLAAGLTRAVEDVIDAPIQAFRMLPHLALAPVFIIWFGIGETSKTMLILIGPIFPLYINVLHGIRGVDNRLVEAARSCGLSRWGLTRRVILPGALPQILVGLRQALGIGWLTLVVAEQTATTSGIGYLMTDAREFLRTDVMFVVLVTYALLGVLSDLLVRLVERRALAWRRGYTGR